MIERFGARGIALAIIGAIILVLLLVLPSQCSRIRSLGAQNKVTHGQLEAQGNSAADAVATQGQANRRESDSEATTRTNERTIRDAEGATDAVNPAVRDAGFASLCKRSSFRDSPTGRLRCSPAR